MRKRPSRGRAPPAVRGSDRQCSREGNSMRRPGRRRAAGRGPDESVRGGGVGAWFRPVTSGAAATEVSSVAQAGGDRTGLTRDARTRPQRTDAGGRVRRRGDSSPPSTRCASDSCRPRRTVAAFGRGRTGPGTDVGSEPSRRRRGSPGVEASGGGRPTVAVPPVRTHRYRSAGRPGDGRTAFARTRCRFRPDDAARASVSGFGRGSPCETGARTLRPPLKITVL